MSDNTVVTENTITNVIEVTSAGPAGPPGGALTIQDEGVDEGLLTDKINFVGSTVSVVNDTEAEIATITVNAADPGANTNITSLGGITGGISSPDYVQFDTAASAAGAVGRLLWNDTDGTLEFQLKGGNVTLQIGQEQVVRVTNTSGVTMTDGQAVYITGSTGNHLNVTLAQANAEATSSKTLAVVTETITNNGTGFATSAGLVRGINTSALTEGAAIWLSPTVPGGLTTTRPTAPNHAVLIGWCVRQSATVGAIFVHIANGYELDELHDVLITAASNNQVLRYDAATGLWKNATISPTLTLTGDVSGSATFTDLGDATLNVTVADDSHNHVISNVDGLQTALDSKFNANSTTDALTEGSSNLYFTTTRARSSVSAGNGISYNSTTGVITNAAPDQTVAITGSGTTTVTGTYPNFTVSSADQYVGTVTSVSGTGTVNGLTLTGTVTSSGSLTLGGTLSVDLSTSTVTGTLPVTKGGTGTNTQFTAGSVVFAGASGVYSQDNAQLFWDDTNNRLGIGTATPSAKLDVNGDMVLPNNGILNFKDAGGVNRNSLQFLSGELRHGGAGAGLTSQTFFTGGSERMRIDSAGNVGIGTSSPSAILDVAGDAKINGLTVGLGAGGISSNTASGYQALRYNTTTVATLGTITGGSGYTDGTYASVQLTYVSGSTAATYPTADITVSGGAVTSVTLVTVGTGFQDTTTVLSASAASIGGTGSGFSVPVASLIAGSYNTASGREALYSNTTGSYNTASGYRALYSNTTGSSNTASGYQALYSNTTGTSNTASGYLALRSNTTGFSNTASGYQALFSNTTGNYNTASGLQALYSNTTGISNTASGLQALYSNTTGISNTASGLQALRSNTTGNNNTASGYQAGYDNTAGTQNTFLGYNTGRGITTGNYNTIVGANVTGLSATLSNNIILADGQGNQRINVDSAGNVGIGTSSPTAKLDVNADTFRVRTAKTPASATAAGNAGDICWNSNYVYVCVATNTWKRSALSTW